MTTTTQLFFHARRTGQTKSAIALCESEITRLEQLADRLARAIAPTPLDIVARDSKLVWVNKRLQMWRDMLAEFRQERAPTE